MVCSAMASNGSTSAATQVPILPCWTAPPATTASPYAEAPQARADRFSTIRRRNDQADHADSGTTASSSRSVASDGLPSVTVAITDELPSQAGGVTPSGAVAAARHRSPRLSCGGSSMYSTAGRRTRPHRGRRAAHRP